MAEKRKTKKERFLELADELFGEDDEEGGGREETTIVLRGKDALRFLGIGDDKPAGGEGDDEGEDGKGKDGDETPKRSGGYFKGQ